MKKAIFTLSCAIVLAFSSIQAKGGTVTITNTSVYGNGFCPAPQSVYLSVTGDAVGYTILTDSVEVYINFGDGNDTLFKVPILLDSLTGDGMYGATALHTYTFSGQFSVLYRVTAPDNAADTVISYNSVIIGNTCGNISGQVYEDANSDCIYNTGDSYLQQHQVELYNSNNVLVDMEWTDASGQYWFNVPTSLSYTIKVSHNGYNIVCPAIDSINVSAFPSTGNDFALNCINNSFDLNSYFWSASIPGVSIPTVLTVYNLYCQNKNGTVKVVFTNPLYSFDNNFTSTPPPAYINGDTVAWNFANVNYYSNAVISFHTYTDTSAQIGDTVCVTVIVTPITGDSIPANNIKQYCFTVATSYDPNDKQVHPLGVGSQGLILPNKELTYSIRFQNTGTATARNIFILDTLDASVLDLSTIQFLEASHPVKIDLISQNVLKFQFDSIMLPDSNANEPASHGYVTYSIEQDPNLANGTQIENSAAIYFDYNPPVITNKTLNTIDDGLVGIEKLSPVSEQFAIVYPNPAGEVVNIEFNKDIQETADIRLTTITGQLVKSIQADDKKTRIRVSSLPVGIYILSIMLENGQLQLNKVVVHR